MINKTFLLIFLKTKFFKYLSFKDFEHKISTYSRNNHKVRVLQKFNYSQQNFTMVILVT